MADLSYSDVQRAVQDGLRNMQSDVQRLQNQITAISQQSQYLSDIPAVLQRLNVQLTRMERQSQGHNPRTELGTAQLTRDVQELKARFTAIERFCLDMSRYMQAQRDRELEDQQYRAA